MDDLKALLSKAQKPALELNKSSLIAAGAGAGKTHTLSAMVVSDLQHGILPDQIVVCTFTKAAALNLRSRIANTLLQLSLDPYLAENILIGTIDSISSRILRERALLAKLSPDFTIADERSLAELQNEAFARAINQLDLSNRSELFTHWDADGVSLQKIIIDALEFLRGRNLAMPSMPKKPVKPKALKPDYSLLDQMAPSTRDKIERDLEAIENEDLSLFSTRKYNQRRQIVGWPELETAINEQYWYLKDMETYNLRTAFIKVLNLFTTDYKLAKADAHVLDFLDLSEHLLSLSDKGIQPQFERLYLDEAQDTSPVQLSMLETLVADTGRLYLFGDANQSIYRFRGADVDNFRKMSQSLGQDVILNENWRSGDSIIEFVNHLASNQEELAKDAVIMKAAKQEINPAPIRWYELSDESMSVLAKPNVRQEALLALEKIDQMQGELNLARRDICILVRSNPIAEHYADVFRQNNVPVQLIQRQGLWKTEEAQDIKAYLTILAEPDNASAWIRVLTGRFGRITPTSLVNLYGALSNADISELIEQYLPEFWKHYQTSSQMPTAIAAINNALYQHNYDLAISFDDQTGSKYRNVELILDELQNLAKQEAAVSPTDLLGVWQEALDAGWNLGQADPDPELDAIKIMTVHNAKGDEFPLTVLVRFNQNELSDKKTIWIDSQGTVGAIINSEPDSIAKVAKEDEKAARQAESQRLLYVALTRAEKGLLLISSTGGLSKSLEPSRSGWAKTLNNAVTSSSHADWLPRKHSVKQLRQLNFQSPTTSPSAQSNITIAQISNKVQRTSISFTNLSNWQACGLRKELEGFWERKLSKSFTLPDDVFISTGNRQIGDEFHKLLAKHDWVNEDVPWSGALQNLGPTWINIMRQEITPGPEMTKEQSFLMPLDDFIFKGSIDHVIKQEDGYTIYDWKTGERAEDDVYLYQAKLYALAILSLFEKPEQVTTIWWDLPNNKQTKQIFTQADVAQLKSEIINWTRIVLDQQPVAASDKFEPYCLGCPGTEFGCKVSQTLN